jgi:hypothetical protein
VQYEIRERNREKDTARLLRSLGIPVKRIPKAKATAKQTAGNQLSDSEEENSSSDEADTGTADDGANTGSVVTANAGDEQSLKPSADGKKSHNDPAPIDLNALLEVMAEFTAAGSDEDAAEKMKKIYQQVAERNATSHD